MFKSEVNLTWSRLPRDLTNRYVRHDQAPTPVLPDVLTTTALPDVVDNSTTKNSRGTSVPLRHFEQDKKIC